MDLWFDPSRQVIIDKNVWTNWAGPYFHYWVHLIPIWSS